MVINHVTKYWDDHPMTWIRGYVVNMGEKQMDLGGSGQYPIDVLCTSFFQVTFFDHPNGGHCVT